MKSFRMFDGEPGLGNPKKKRRNKFSLPFDRLMILQHTVPNCQSSSLSYMFNNSRQTTLFVSRPMSLHKSCFFMSSCMSLSGVRSSVRTFYLNNISSPSPWYPVSELLSLDGPLLHSGNASGELKVALWTRIELICPIFGWQVVDSTVLSMICACKDVTRSYKNHPSFRD